MGPTHPYKGGVAQHTTMLAEHLAEAGHRVDLLSWSAQYPKRLYPGELELDESRTEATFPGTRRALAWYDPTSWWRSAAGPASDADLVVLSVVNGFQVPAYAAIMKRVRRHGARVVALCHNVKPHEADPLQQRLLKWLLGSVDGVLVHSEVEAGTARSVGVAAPVVARLPFFFPTPESGPRPPGERTGRLLFFGLVRPYKGIDVLIRAVARADTPVEVTIAGEFWTPVERTRDLAGELGLEDRVQIIDDYLAPEAIMDLFSEHDALVCPYLSGTGSQQPQIAHLAGRPAIATRVGDLADQVVDGVDGMLVEPGDVDALAAAIDRLYDGETLEALTSGVRPPDVPAQWAEYIEALLSA